MHQCTLDLFGIAHIDGDNLHSQRRRRGLDGGPLTDSSGDSRVADDGRSRYSGCDLLEQLKPFPRYAVFICGEAGNISAGRARLLTIPAPTGSGTITNTIGTVRVNCTGAQQSRCQ
jgi:hypothetical protein